MFKMFRKCQHPFSKLGVYADSTTVIDNDCPRDFYIVTHHLYCQKCNKKLDIKYAKCIGGIEEFLKRG